MVRVHVQETLGDLLASRREEGSFTLRDAMARIGEAKQGVVVILRREGEAQELLQRIRDYHLEDKGIVLPRPPADVDRRRIGVGAQILADLGVRKMRLIGTPRVFHGLSGFDLEVVSYLESR